MKGISKVSGTGKKRIYPTHRGLSKSSASSFLRFFQRVRHLLGYRATQYRLLQEKLVQASSFNTVAAQIGKVPISIWQKPKEFLELLSVLRRNPPKTLLEIGTCGGGSLYFFAQVAHPEAEIYSIDIRFPKNSMNLYKGFAIHNQRITLLERDSHDLTTLSSLRKDLNGKQLEFLFIDGDHSPKGVRSDYKMYSPLVKNNGLIAFHDIRDQYWPGIESFWNELKIRHSSQEIIYDPLEKWAGIGLIWKDGRKGGDRE